LRNALYNKSRRAEAVAALALARDLATAAGDADGVTLAIFYQMWDAIEQGRFEDAESLDAEYRQRPSPPEVYSRPGDVAFWRCYNLFQQGLLTEEDWGNVHMQFVFLGLHAEWNLERNRPDEVLDDVDQALQIANRVGASEREYHDLRAWALAKLGYHNESRAELNKGVYGRFAAEVYLVLGERSQVAWCARNTYRWAWGAGPPYIQWYDLERSKALLKQVGEAEPQLPPFDPTTVPPVPFETEIRAAIAELNAKKEKREKPDPAQ
jgi:hypothetical protein